MILKKGNMLRIKAVSYYPASGQLPEQVYVSLEVPDYSIGVLDRSDVFRCADVISALKLDVASVNVQMGSFGVLRVDGSETRKLIEELHTTNSLTAKNRKEFEQLGLLDAGSSDLFLAGEAAVSAAVDMQDGDTMDREEAALAPLSPEYLALATEAAVEAVTKGLSSSLLLLRVLLGDGTSERLRTSLEEAEIRMGVGKTEHLSCSCVSLAAIELAIKVDEFLLLPDSERAQKFAAWIREYVQLIRDTKEVRLAGTLEEKPRPRLRGNPYNSKTEFEIRMRKLFDEKMSVLPQPRTSDRADLEQLKQNLKEIEVTWRDRAEVSMQGRDVEGDPMREDSFARLETEFRSYSTIHLSNIKELLDLDRSQLPAICHFADEGERKRVVSELQKVRLPAKGEWLHLALLPNEHRDYGNERAYALLLERGADPATVNSGGLTARHAAGLVGWEPSSSDEDASSDSSEDSSEDTINAAMQTFLTKVEAALKAHEDILKNTQSLQEDLGESVMGLQLFIKWFAKPFGADPKAIHSKNEVLKTLMPLCEMALNSKAKQDLHELVNAITWQHTSQEFGAWGGKERFFKPLMEYIQELHRLDPNFDPSKNGTQPDARRRKTLIAHVKANRKLQVDNDGLRTQTADLSGKLAEQSRLRMAQEERIIKIREQKAALEEALTSYQQRVVAADETIAQQGSEIVNLQTTITAYDSRFAEQDKKILDLTVRMLGLYEAQTQSMQEKLNAREADVQSPPGSKPGSRIGRATASTSSSALARTTSEPAGRAAARAEDKRYSSPHRFSVFSSQDTPEGSPADSRSGSAASKQRRRGSDIAVPPLSLGALAGPSSTAANNEPPVFRK